jgi:hypothetical protein
MCPIYKKIGMKKNYTIVNRAPRLNNAERCNCSGNPRGTCLYLVKIVTYYAYFLPSWKPVDTAEVPMPKFAPWKEKLTSGKLN